MKKLILLIIIIFIPIFSGFAEVKKSPVLIAAKKELDRTMKGLADESNPPYFLSYEIIESKVTRMTASFGKIKNEIYEHTRNLDVDIRVGDYSFDNTHIIRGNRFEFGPVGGSATLPLGDDEKAIRNAIWYATDVSYKNAIERYDKAKTNQAVKVKEEDSSADLSHETLVQYYENFKNINYDKQLFENRIRKLSAIFNEEDWLYVGDVMFTAENHRKIIVNSEGTELQFSQVFFRIFVQAKTKSDDGMSLPLYESYFSYSPDSLPDDEKIISDINSMIELLKKLRAAPKLETTYSGPAILSGEAAGVFFHEIFGHRVEGHREKDPNSSQTFKHSINEKILPDFIDVIMNPTIKTYRNHELSGYFKFDDEGIKAQKVIVAEKGRFKNFLMSRSPIENFPRSNGHGRKQAGFKAVSRQSNLIVVAHKTVSRAELRKKLIEECKEAGKDYGLYFVKVQGGFTFTGRSIPNAFNVNPLVVYKIYVDGRPDELLRGVDLIGTPLATFANISAASDDFEVFNGICGAESGGVPVSASSPSLLVSRIEVQKKAKSQAKLPILESPVSIKGKKI